MIVHPDTVTDKTYSLIIVPCPAEFAGDACISQTRGDELNLPLGKTML